MSKKSKTTQADTTAELVVLESATTIQPVEPAEIDAEVAADNEKKKSVVLPKYKHRYAERAANAGIAKKAAQRSAWDWLAQTLAAQCLDERQRIDIAKFTRILEMNGVDHSRWTNRSKGWEGRFRMTGRLALQRIVAECGVMQVEDDVLEAPADWVAKFKN
jgi:hypothetical protein